MCQYVNYVFGNLWLQTSILKVCDAIQTNHVKMVVEVCGIIEIGFTLHKYEPMAY